MADHKGELQQARRDVVSLGVAAAAILMFVGTGGTVFPRVLAALSGHGAGPDRTLASALLLNVALVIFGWRRYCELTREVEERRLAETLEKAEVYSDGG